MRSDLSIKSMHNFKTIIYILIALLFPTKSAARNADIDIIMTEEIIRLIIDTFVDDEDMHMLNTLSLTSKTFYIYYSNSKIYLEKIFNLNENYMPSLAHLLNRSE